MFERPIFIDFDGVIFDTEKRVIEQKEQLPKISWEEFFATLDWFKLLEKSKIINNAVDYILEKKEKNKKIAILTKIHTLLEMQAKVNKLRNCNINVPILFVPPHIKKTSSLLVNHAFQDGYHIGLFFNNLQQNIYKLKIDKNLVKVR